MIERPQIKKEAINIYYEKLKKDTESGGYYLNPDIEFTKDLVEGLIVNEKRYGYPSCPCRAASGIKKDDLDIICPCDYRDPDLEEHDACFCGLYVTKNAIDNEKKIGSIPERRPSKNDAKTEQASAPDIKKPLIPIWRCRVCGYLCARENPPEICPICKAKKERFEIFIDTN